MSSNGLQQSGILEA
uniref:Uncharacterized protein n=1 Tax=Bracon brevicornis TaxID=1563983 RepID=A0A6V7ISS5_9HYME